MVALPFCHFWLSAAKPKDANYPREIVSIGDHIRARRIELGLLQRQIAARIGVTISSVLNWEKNRSVPSLRFSPRVMLFLGYDPYVGKVLFSIADKLKAQRTKLGLSRRRLAALLRVDESNLAGWETGKHKPNKRSMELISKFLGSTDFQTRSTGVGS